MIYAIVTKCLNTVAIIFLFTTKNTSVTKIVKHILLKHYLLFLAFFVRLAVKAFFTEVQYRITIHQDNILSTCFDI